MPLESRSARRPESFPAVTGSDAAALKMVTLQGGVVGAVAPSPALPTRIGAS